MKDFPWLMILGDTVPMAEKAQYLGLACCKTRYVKVARGSLPLIRVHLPAAPQPPKAVLKYMNL